MNNFPMRNGGLVLRLAVLALLCTFLFFVVAPLKGVTAGAIVQLAFVVMLGVYAYKNDALVVSTKGKILVTRNIVKPGTDPDGLPLYNYYLPPLAVLLPLVEKKVGELTTGRVGTGEIKEESFEIRDTIAKIVAKFVLSIDPDVPHNYVRYAIDENQGEEDLKLNDTEIKTLVTARLTGFLSSIAKLCGYRLLSENATVFSDAITEACNFGVMTPEFYDTVLQHPEAAAVLNKFNDLAPSLYEICQERGILVDFELETVDLVKDSDPYRAAMLSHAGVLRQERFEQILASLTGGRALTNDEETRLRERAWNMVLLEAGEYDNATLLDIKGLESAGNIHIGSIGAAAGKPGGGKPK